ncbi:hypothetical protein F2Q68_00001821 [Brassica cretica]|uniref:BHLH domain-containing protein n=1 Tax=Brassica cretica TaxID=69181 RepID=A0A8S9JA53_BRACR|nr:hypothetical protein F2Q68_00001821 [Brassica cretica]
MPQTSMEMSMINIPEDSVPWKVRAKRGCATHPRSIAERERRTRISGKLKKLQELVPNMDKQTSYADMLDLAVEHIKGLQHHIENCKIVVKFDDDERNLLKGGEPNLTWGGSVNNENPLTSVEISSTIIAKRESPNA